MNATEKQATVGEMVVERPARARVFEKFGIDYCCGGRKPLSQACQEKQIDLAIVEAELAEADRDRVASERDWAKASLAELADHVVTTHHDFLRRELPRLDFLTRKVSSVHGEHRPELVELREVFVGFMDELVAHMQKEEQILFPLCRQLENDSAAPAFHCGSIRNPIRMMIQEHDSAGHAMERMRALTDDYTPPLDACGSYRAMLEGLEAIEKDMHQHVHKENNILFPRAAETEARRVG